MANKRILKKQVHYICADIALECSIALQTIPDINEEIITDAIRDLAILQTDTLRKISFSFDRAPRDYEVKSVYNKERASYNKTAFRKLQVEFNEKILEIVNKMNSALPKINKEA